MYWEIQSTNEAVDAIHVRCQRTVYGTVRLPTFPLNIGAHYRASAGHEKRPTFQLTFSCRGGQSRNAAGRTDDPLARGVGRDRG